MENGEGVPDGTLANTSGSGFAQQGSLDWVSLSRSSVAFTVDILGRFMAAGVQPFTIMVGQEIAKNLRLSTSGEKNIQDALNSLRSYRGLGDVIWFGFGLRSLVRTLGSTTEGKGLVALCSALGETFHEDFAATVLHSMTASYNPPSGFMPSLKEWQMLVKACSGVLAHTKFPVLVDSFTRLVPRQRRLQQKLQARRSGQIPDALCPSPHDLSVTILALGMLSRNHFHQISIKGGVGAGWLAAVGEWMYGFNVSIIDAKGMTMYQTKDCVSRPGLVIQLDDDSLATATATTVDLTLAVTSKTFRLRDRSGIMKLLSISEPPFYGGRLPWDECFREAYGLEFAQLLKLEETIGTGFGCAARIFAGIMDFESPGVDLYHATQHKHYFTESGGRGFIRNSFEICPELHSLTQISYKQLDRSFKDAQIEYIRSMFEIRKACKCSCCLPQGESSSINSLCRLAIFESVIIICQILSTTAMATKMGMRRDGMMWVYHNAHNAIADTPRRSGTPGQDLVRQTEINRILNPTFLENEFLGCMMLFAGRKTTDENGANAFSHGGVCSFYSVLQDFVLDREVLGRISIVPGHIEWGGSSYPSIRDRNDISSMPEPVQSIQPMVSVSLGVTQQVESLQIDFLFGLEDNSMNSALAVGPASLIKAVLKSRGTAFHCRRASVPCATTFEIEPTRGSWSISNPPRLAPCLGITVKWAIREDEVSTVPWGLRLTESGKTEYFTSVGILPSIYDTDVAKAVAIVVATHLKKDVILADSQCNACCIQPRFGKGIENLFIVTL
ncbi:hypothetical protein PFICI_02409 [Pestalotiopsis fici W106-1]|uniref:Uncharacterized protein n=1 Tax=Pestalotiopsis fici (strain W106-1 / CGMCC3.15140) TaxID=1229662 RepID=W3XED9_PESFW|nr:uncharacterized protein PFICI_02409 [Pestalotiopsis fici W106-1]ETS84384.1 hypothetical protein PFICI_02409 [Pestalotiopsis fici W106-1]